MQIKFSKSKNSRFLKKCVRGKAHFAKITRSSNNPHLNNLTKYQVPVEAGYLKTHTHRRKSQAPAEDRLPKKVLNLEKPPFDALNGVGLSAIH